MMLLLDVLSQPVWQRLTWTLLHFLWQGLGIAAIMLAVFWLFRVRGASLRYAISLLAMLLMALCPPITFVVLERSSERTAASDSTSEGIARGRGGGCVAANSCVADRMANRDDVRDSRSGNRS